MCKNEKDTIITINGDIVKSIKVEHSTTVITEKPMVTMEALDEHGLKVGFLELSSNGKHSLLTYDEFENMRTLTNIIVRPDLRGKGIGTILLTCLCEYLDRNKIQVELEVLSFDADKVIKIKKLYEKFGFIPYSDSDHVMVRL